MDPTVAEPTLGGRRTDGDATPWLYEVVPLVELPALDLSVSIASHFVRSPRVIRFIHFMLGRSFTYFSYIAYAVLGLASMAVPASSGRVVAVVGFSIGLVPSLLTISMLRYDMVVVLLTMYDTWFFGVLSIASSVVFAMIMNDTRALLVLHVCVVAVFNIFIDANVLSDVRRVWIGNFLSMVVYVVMAACISTNITDELHQFDVLSTKTNRSLPASTIVSNGLISVSAMIIRNVFRQRQHFSTASSSSAAVSPHDTPTLVTCVSLRSRLQLRSVSSRRGPALSAIATTSRKAQLLMAPFLATIDVRDTVVPLPSWFWGDDPEHPSHSTHVVVWLRRSFKLIGVVGFVALNTSIGHQAIGSPFVNQSLIAFLTLLGSCASLLFTGICVSVCQRKLLWALVTSFDFLFVAAQITALHVTIAEMLGRKPLITAALVVDWVWTTWAMCWDALTPPARRRLGLTHRFSAVISTALIAYVVVNGVLVFFVAPLHTVNDHVIWHLDLWGRRIEFNPVSWYCSCVATIISSTIRVVWRKWGAVENELVSLDGPVVYERRVKTRASNDHVLHPSPPHLSQVGVATS